MQAILSVFRKEFWENLRDRRTGITALVFGPLLGPVLFAVILSLSIQRGVNEGTKPLTVAVVHGERAPNLVDFLREYGVTVEPATLDGAGARNAVNQHRYAMVLEVGADFGARLSMGAPAPLAFYTDASDPSHSREVSRVRVILTQYGSLIARMRAMARGLDPLILTPIAVQDIDVSTPAGRSILVLGAFSYLIIVTMLMGGMYLAIDATAGERERGSLEPLLTVPVKREDLIYGKMLATCAFMAISLSLSVMEFSVVLRFADLERLGMSANFGPLISLKIILSCLPLVPVGAALMTIVASFTRSYREAQTYVGLMLAIPTMPLAFAAISGLRPSASLMSVPSLGQHFLITSLLRDEPISMLYVLVSVGATLALAALLMYIAGRLYHREALLG